MKNSPFYVTYLASFVSLFCAVVGLMCAIFGLGIRYYHGDFSQDYFVTSLLFVFASLPVGAVSKGLRRYAVYTGDRTSNGDWCFQHNGEPVFLKVSPGIGWWIGIFNTALISMSLVMQISFAEGWLTSVRTIVLMGLIVVTLALPVMEAWSQLNEIGEGKRLKSGEEVVSDVTGAVSIVVPVGDPDDDLYAVKDDTPELRESLLKAKMALRAKDSNIVAYGNQTRA